MPSDKYGGGSITLWRWFVAGGPGAVTVLNLLLWDILAPKLYTSARLGLGFQQDYELDILSNKQKIYT